MRSGKILAVFLAAAVFAAAPLGIARNHRSDTACAAAETIGLIEKCSISCISDVPEHKLKIQAKTQASGVMDKIGFRKIIVQMSTDQRNWADVADLGEFVREGKKFYTLDCTFDASETGYYRVVCTHFAAGKTFLGKVTETQTAENTSRAAFMYVPKPVTTTSVTGKSTSTAAKATTVTNTTATAKTTTVNNSDPFSAAPKTSAGTGVSHSGSVDENSAGSGVSTTTSAKSGSSGSSPATGDTGAAAAIIALAAASAAAVTFRRRRG